MSPVLPKTPFDALALALTSMLMFRSQEADIEFRSIMSAAAKAGTLNSGGLFWSIGDVVEAETLKRAILVRDEVRSYRASCSPRQLVEGEQDLRRKVREVLEESLGTMARSAENTLQIQHRRQQAHYVGPISQFKVRVGNAFDNAFSLVNAAVSEVVQSAQTASAASTMAERPGYLIQNFHGPIGAIAQQGGKIESATQSNQAATLQDITCSVAGLLEAVSQLYDKPKEATEASAELSAAQADLDQGRIPIGRLQKAVTLLSQAGDLAIQAPSVWESIRSLANMIGLSL